MGVGDGVVLGGKGPLQLRSAPALWFWPQPRLRAACASRALLRTEAGFLFHGESETRQLSPWPFAESPKCVGFPLRSIKRLVVTSDSSFVLSGTQFPLYGTSALEVDGR